MVIRLRLKSKLRETASRVAEDLQRRYDLLFLHLETPKPVRLTAIVRWGILNSKFPALEWESPVPTQATEDYLAGELDHCLPPPIGEKYWAQVVNRFVTGCSQLDKVTRSLSRGYRTTCSMRGWQTTQALNSETGYQFVKVALPTARRISIDRSSSRGV